MSATKEQETKEGTARYLAINTQLNCASEIERCLGSSALVLHFCARVCVCVCMPPCVNLDNVFPLREMPVAT